MKEESSLSFFSMAVTKHLPKPVWQSKGLFVWQVHYWEKPRNSRQDPGPELKQRLWRKAAYWLVSSSLISYLPYTSHTLLSRSSTDQCRWAHPPSTGNKENASYMWPQARVMEAMSSWWTKTDISETQNHSPVSVILIPPSLHRLHREPALSVVSLALFYIHHFLL